MRRQVSLRWSVALLVVGSVLVAQLVGLALLLAFPSPGPMPMVLRQVADALTDADAARRAGLTRVEQSDAPFDAQTAGLARFVASTLSELLPGRQIRVRPLAKAVRDPLNPLGKIVSVTSVHLLSPDLARMRSAASLGPILASVPLPAFETAMAEPDGRWVVVGPHRPFWSWPRRVLAAFVAGVLLMAPLAWLAARRLTRPIEQLAHASERLGRDTGAPPLDLDGPSEVRTAAGAFNGMQARLARHLDQRTQMMAAIAHDLRTPLTSLRLRAETAPPRERARMIADIARMETMANDLLTFARGQPSNAIAVPVDVLEMIGDCIRDAVERGGTASLGNATRCTALADPVGLRRALDNVVANAINYGGGALIEVAEASHTISITILDDGPGIPQDDLDRVVAPFVRLETSRSRNTGGSGLGLAIASSIMAANQGRLTLQNRPCAGLAAELLLPKQHVG